MIVVDASVAVKWVFDEEHGAAATALLKGGEPMIAPSLWLTEAANVLWRRCVRGDLSPQEAGAALEFLTSGPVELVADAPLAAPALTLALALGHPIYDCLYLALAIRERAQLVTADTKLALVARRGGYGAVVRELVPSPQP